VACAVIAWGTAAGLGSPPKGAFNHDAIRENIKNDNDDAALYKTLEYYATADVARTSAPQEEWVKRQATFLNGITNTLYAVGGQELGYLPGSESDKMGPWAQAVFDTLEGLASPAVLEEVLSRGMLEVLPLTHIRGRSLHDSFVIVDEAQSLERNVLLTVLSRLGSGSRVVLTHDVAQRDNLRVGRHDGVAAVIEKLKGHPLFGHITLMRSERSPIAALVTEMLEEITPDALP
jgi:hypothetical protein